jgi:hypothetical protein
MCLKNQQSRIDRVDGIPNPIIVAIYVERKEINFPGAAAFHQQLIDVFDSDPAVCQHRGIKEAVFLGAKETICS